MNFCFAHAVPCTPVSSLTHAPGASIQRATSSTTLSYSQNSLKATTNGSTRTLETSQPTTLLIPWDELTWVCSTNPRQNTSRAGTLYASFVSVCLQCYCKQTVCAEWTLEEIWAGGGGGVGWGMVTDIIREIDKNIANQNDHKLN